MTTSFYKSTIGAFIRQTEALQAIVAKGREHLGDDADNFVNESLCEDMLPFSFQIRAVHHAAHGMINALSSGEAGTPPAMEVKSYGELETLLEESAAAFKAITPEKLDELAENDILFAVGDMKIPFKGLGFMNSFITPNFYFHVTTAYNLLRQKGVPLGKRDFLGAMDMNFG